MRVPHHQNQTDNSALKEQRSPFVQAHYPCPLPLLCFTRAKGKASTPRTSLHNPITVPVQSICTSYLFLFFLIMQFILSTCHLHPDFLPQTFIPLYFCSYNLFASAMFFLSIIIPIVTKCTKEGQHRDKDDCFSSND